MTLLTLPITDPAKSEAEAEAHYVTQLWKLKLNKIC